MKPEIRDHALDAYFTTKRDWAGSGLGLATVQDFVRNAGGDVEIDSAPDAGTTVRLSFPPGPSSIDELHPPVDTVLPVAGCHGADRR